MNNIIIIICDAFRCKNLSLFGYEKETDKNFKKIAKESILFKNHFSTSNSTAPALTSIFTGNYPNKHGIIHQVPYTKQEEIDKLEKDNKFWLPNYLKDKGYETIAIDWIGLWLKNGFDYYEEKEEKQTLLKRFMRTPIIHKFSLNLPNWAYKLGRKIIKVKTGASGPFCPARETADLAISKIKKAKKPFFLFMHFWDTHFPYPNTKYTAKGYEKDLDKVVRNIKDRNQREYLKKRIVDTNLYSVQDVINKYDLTLKTLDKEIGRIYEFLKKQNLWDNTIFIILGDHGQTFTEHEIYFSSSGLYEESVHVPLFMHLPGIKSGESNGLVQNVDILPTILEHLGLETREKFDGKSLFPLIKKGKAIRNKAFLFDGLGVDIKAVRTANRKLILARNNLCYLCKSSHHKGKEEYNLEDDIGETKNIYSGKSELAEFLEKDL